MTTTPHRLQSSSSAKADDPVFQSSHWEAHARRRLLDARVRGLDGKGFKKLSDKLRILITGFGPFPGAPFNPTEPLVARLKRLRRPAFRDVEFNSHHFHYTYANVDRHIPLTLLMFVLAGRTAHMRVESRARNAVTTLWPDADRTRARKGSIVGDAD